MGYIGQAPTKIPLTSADIADGTIALADMAVNSIDSDQYVDGSIDTAHIATNQIDETLLKDAFVGDFSDVTVTAADAFLYGDATDSGNTKKDTVQGILDLAGGAGLVPLTEIIASDDATIDFGLSTATDGFVSTYDSYLLQGNDIRNATGNTELRVLFMDASGVVLTATNYKWAHRAFMTNGVEIDSYQNPSGVGYARAVGTMMELTTAYRLHFSMWFHNPLATTYPQALVHWTHRPYTGYSGAGFGHIHYHAAAANKGVQFLSSSGNILEGSFRLYGISKSF